MKFDVLSLGPARMDVFVNLLDHDVAQICSIDRRRCMIELGFGEKVPVQGIGWSVGGNAGNNAVGLARLGYKTGIVGAVGTGFLDQQVKDTLDREQVDTTHLQMQGDDQGLGVVINYQAERTILSHYAPARGAFPQDPAMLATWVYLTSMGEDWEEFYKQSVQWSEQTGAKIAFNPGGRQIKGDISAVLQRSELLFVNREEGNAILGANHKSQASTPKELLMSLHNFGPKVVVVTDGPDGAFVTNGQKQWFMPVIPAPVVERTGAGDAFGAGFMAAVLHGYDVGEAMRWGACNSGSVLGYIGPQQGLLTREQMQEWLKKHQDVRVKEL